MEQELHPTVRKDERSKAQRWRYIPLAFALAVIVMNVAVYRNPVVYGLVPLLAAGVTLAVVIPLNQRNKKLVASFTSREQLSEYISRLPTHLKRFNWVWLEYSMARNIVRGTYNGEPPSDFITDVGYVSRRLVRRTKFNARWTIGSAAFLNIFCIGLTVLMLALDVFSIWIAIVFVAVPLVLSVVYFNTTVGSSDDPRRILARRIEDSVDLEGSRRWEELLVIARDEQSYDLDA